MTKTTRKSRAIKSVKNLAPRTLTARSQRSVKGGGESLSLNFGKIEYEYKIQSADGATKK